MAEWMLYVDNLWTKASGEGVRMRWNGNGIWRLQGNLDAQNQRSIKRGIQKLPPKKLIYKLHIQKWLIYKCTNEKHFFWNLYF